MTRDVTSALLAIIPVSVLGTGVAFTNLEPWGAPSPGALPWGPIIAAGLAPIGAGLALALIAPDFDRVLLAITAGLTAAGMTALGSLARTSGADTGFYAEIAAKQGWFIALGFLALLFGAAGARYVDRLRGFPLTLLGSAILLTTVTVVLGDVVNGARLWLSVGPARFQPSEIARLLLAMFVAVYLHERRHLVSGSWRIRSIEFPPAPYLIQCAIALTGAVGVIALQNDLGMAALVMLGATAVTIAVSRSWSLTAAAGAILTGALVWSYWSVPRVRDRVAGWLDPWADPAGRGFQFVQSEFSLAAGGLSGNSGSAPASNVPEVHTDLILVAIGTGFGLLGATAVVALAGLLVARCAMAALHASDGFRSLVALSIAALLAIQIVLIVGGTLRVLPLTGLTLPLVSYGGTSMVVTLFAIGLVLGLGARADFTSRASLAPEARPTAEFLSRKINP